MHTDTPFSSGGLPYAASFAPSGMCPGMYELVWLCLYFVRDKAGIGTRFVTPSVHTVVGNSSLWLSGEQSQRKKTGEAQCVKETSWGIPGKPSRYLDSFQSVTSALGLEESKKACVYALQGWILNFLQLSYTSHWFSNHIRELIILMLDPGLRCLMCVLNPLLPRENFWACNIPLVFWISW